MQWVRICILTSTRGSLYAYYSLRSSVLEDKPVACVEFSIIAMMLYGSLKKLEASQGVVSLMDDLLNLIWHQDWQKSTGKWQCQRLFFSFQIQGPSFHSVKGWTQLSNNTSTFSSCGSPPRYSVPEIKRGLGFFCLCPMWLLEWLSATCFSPRFSLPWNFLLASHPWEFYKLVPFSWTALATLYL